MKSINLDLGVKSCFITIPALKEKLLKLKDNASR
jgi:hypothetical protein